MKRGSKQSGKRRACPFVAWPGAFALALMLGGCFTAAIPDRKVTTAAVEPQKPVAQLAAAAITPTLREHQRILTAYNGVYDDPRLDGLIRETVDKLVSASERPDQRYRITVLNSPAINAFALPSGDLYVTRGLGVVRLPIRFLCRPEVSLLTLRREG